MLAGLHAQAFAEERAWSAPEIATLLGVPGTFTLVHAVGGMAMARVVADEADILTVCVWPPARRQGVGAALVRACCAEALARGAKRIFLEVAADNAPAVGLYGTLGFARAGTRRSYYGPGSDAIVMRAELAPLAAATGG
jgi:ribosomal-protein-alanine N-acetyltransferase